VSIPEDIAKRHEEWKDMRSFGMVYSERQEGDKEPTMETRVYITSMQPRVKKFGQAVRNHWGVETSLHWVLDMSFREDDSRLHKGHGQANMCLIRRLCASSLLSRSADHGMT